METTTIYLTSGQQNTPSAVDNNGRMMVVNIPQTVVARRCRLSNGLYFAFNNRWINVVDYSGISVDLASIQADIDAAVLRIDALEALVNPVSVATTPDELARLTGCRLLHNIDIADILDYDGTVLSNGDVIVFPQGMGEEDGINGFRSFNNAGRPTYTTGGVNSQSYLSFDGSANCMSAGYNNAQAVTLLPRQSLTFMWVVDVTAGSGTTTGFYASDSATANDWFGFRWVGASNVFTLTMRNTAGTITNVSSGVLGTGTYLAGFRIYKNASDNYVLQVYDSTNGWSATGTYTASSFSIGSINSVDICRLRRSSGNLFYSASIYELIMTIGRFWEPSDMASYFNNKYGITPA